MLQQDFKEGALLLIDKPYKWTSFDVVGYFKKIVKVKVGHAGTLDPLATGLLVLCTGNFTKQLPALQVQEKQYTGVIVLGASTPSFDLETEIDKYMPISHITHEKIEAAFKTFVGLQQQVAPLYSAKHIDGERAYYKARRGENIEVPPNSIDIISFDCMGVTFNQTTIEVAFSVACSKGTYIRSIARDIAIALDTVGYLSELRRTRCGSYDIKDAVTMEDIKSTFKIDTRKPKHQNV